MKTLAILLLTSGAAAAAPLTVLVPAIHGEAQHGGGCRKSSPPGQCCHAGSQPLHCH